MPYNRYDSSAPALTDNQGQPYNRIDVGGRLLVSMEPVDYTIYALVARTATPTKVDQTNHNAKGLHLVIDVTAASATPSVVFTIQGKDALSGKYYTILASSAITGTGTTVLRVYPHLTAAANSVANDILPHIWAVDATHADADSITYSVGASLIW